MKTKNIIGAGLCTILLGASTSVSGQDKPKPKLEVTVEQSTYLGPDGNYSFKVNPKARGLFRPTHQVLGSGYHDSYPSMPGQIPGILMIERIEVNGDLRDLYEVFETTYIDKLSNPKNLAPGEKYISIDNEPLKNVIVDSYPAIQGNVKLLVVDAKGNEVNTKVKYNILLTLAQDKKNVYSFMNYYMVTEGMDITYKNYNYILKNFKILK